MSRILDKDFKYTPAAATDIRKTFARIRRQMSAAPQDTALKREEVVAQRDARGSESPAVAAPNVRALKRATR